MEDGDRIGWSSTQRIWTAWRTGSRRATRWGQLVRVQPFVGAPTAPSMSDQQSKAAHRRSILTAAVASRRPAVHLQREVQLTVTKVTVHLPPTATSPLCKSTPPPHALLYEDEDEDEVYQEKKMKKKMSTALCIL